MKATGFVAHKFPCGHVFTPQEDLCPYCQIEALRQQVAERGERMKLLRGNTVNPASYSNWFDENGEPK